MTDTANQDTAAGPAGEQAAGQQEARPSAEQRAEALMERAGSEVGRFLTRAVARTREEVEDVIAEAQAIRHGQRPPGGPGEGQRPDEAA
jgi:hypothetical protein